MPNGEVGSGERSPIEIPVLDDIQVIVVSQEEASFGVAEFWSGDRQIGITCLEDGELTLRILHSADDLVLGAQALTKALAEADRVLALY
jgi:hypothetical protein